MDDKRLAGMALTVTVAALVGYGAWTLAEDDEPVPAPVEPPRVVRPPFGPLVPAPAPVLVPIPTPPPIDPPVIN